MPKEIERKFWVRELPDGLEGVEYEDLEQGYLAIDQSAHEVRLRRGNGRLVLTVKSGGRLTRQEYEIQLDTPQFETLWPATASRRLRKRRYYFSRHNPQITLDIYQGRFEGLLLAEVEFESKEAAEAYTPAEWMGTEVTRQSFLKNKNLLDIDSYEEIERMLLEG